MVQGREGDGRATGTTYTLEGAVSVALGLLDPVAVSLAGLVVGSVVLELGHLDDWREGDTRWDRAAEKNQQGRGTERSAQAGKRE